MGSVNSDNGALECNIYIFWRHEDQETGKLPKGLYSSIYFLKETKVLRNSGSLPWLFSKPFFAFYCLLFHFKFCVLSFLNSGVVVRCEYILKIDVTWNKVLNREYIMSNKEN